MIKYENPPINFPDQLAKEIQNKANELNTDVNMLIVNAVEKFVFMLKIEEARKDLKGNYNKVHGNQKKMCLMAYPDESIMHPKEYLASINRI